MIWLLALTLLGCAPRYSNKPPMSPDELWAPLPVQHVSINGVDVAHIDSGGSGEPIVFIHGLSSYMGFWEYQVPEFAKDHRVLALDLPGYGASDRPDAPYTPPWYADLVSDWLVEMGVEKATIVGHSMGGQIAITLALENPEQVDRLVLVAPAGFERFKRGHGQWMKDYWTERRTLGTKEQDTRSAFVNLVFNNADEGVERLIEERVRMGYHPSFEGTSVAVSRCIAGMIDHPVADRLSEVQIPTLIVYGTDDHLIPNSIFNGGRTRDVAESGHAALPQSTLVMIRGAGHGVHHDEPAIFNDAVRGFLVSE